MLGFPARKGKEREEQLALAARLPHAVVLYESPNRLVDTLRDLSAIAGTTRPVAVARELTKVHEEVLTGTAASILERLSEDRGEFTLVIGPPPDEAGTAPTPSDAQIWTAYRELTDREEFGRREAVTALARRYGLPAKQVYAAIERAKESPPAT
jgi:16S rRNA (cytidine1402-2'-O)-methyltransferase